MSTGLIFALISAIAAIGYGWWSRSWILNLPTGNERMVEISNAVQEGAMAYLNRQYTTIGIVGAVLFVVIGFALGWASAVGFAIGNTGYVATYAAHGDKI